MLNEARISPKKTEWISYNDDNEDNDGRDNEEVKELNLTKPKLKRTASSIEEVLKCPLMNLSTHVSSVSTPCQDENLLNFLESPIPKKKKISPSYNITHPLVNLPTQSIHLYVSQVLPPSKYVPIYNTE